MVKTNLVKVRENIANAAKKAGRSPEGVRLITVTKEASSNQIFDAISMGAGDLGENRVRDALLKYRAIGDKVCWHLIGHLQTNKVKDAVKMFTYIHSVDSAKLAKAIDKEAEKLGKVQNILIEINVSNEETKFGIQPSVLESILQEIKDFTHIKVCGLMAMTPLTDNPENSREHFRVLRQLANNFGLIELSMGMTQDYEVAVEEGATMVRVGRAIFK